MSKPKLAKVDILTPNASIPVDVVLSILLVSNTERPEHRRRAREAIEERAMYVFLHSHPPTHA